MSEATTPDGAPRARISGALARARRAVPPVRLLWLLLAALAGYGIWFLGGGLGVASAVALPLTAAIVDLAIQRVRFERLRFPDAALATGLFLALLFPPVVPLVAAISTTILAVTLRHALRAKGRPWFNPAALGIVFGALLFGILPAWWGAISEVLVLALGIAVVVWQRSTWRLPAVFLLAYAALAVLMRIIVSISSGVVLVPKVLLLTAVDPTVLFFGLFMVAEPRTAPSDAPSQVVFAIVVAAAAAMLPLGLPALALPLALLLGNTVALALRWRASLVPSGSADARGRGRAARPRSAAQARWSLGRRVGVGFTVFLLVGVIALATYSPASSPAAVLTSHGSPGGGTVAAATACQTDNASVPSSTLSSLHKSLGPSVILSYTPSTNLVVFYDPVNAVTVTETDLYEDYGFAEFNGDDYTSVGCVPP